MVSNPYNEEFTGRTHIVMPGFEGRPFRGRSIPDLVKGGKAPVERNYAKIRILDLSDPKALEEYQSICDLIAKGWCALSREEVQWVEEKKNWVVLIRYIEKYAEMEGELEQRVYYDTKKGRMALKPEDDI